VNRDGEAGKKSAEPFGYQAISSSPQDLQRCAEFFAAERFPSARTRLWNGERYPHAKIRLGYLSGEFRTQATAILMTELFELHDRDRFELVAFTTAGVTGASFGAESKRPSMKWSISRGWAISKRRR